MKTFLINTFIILMSSLSYGQNTEHIKWDYFTSSVSFFREGTKIKDFNVPENNPYNHLKYPVDKREARYMVYDISKVDKNTIINTLLPEIKGDTATVNEIEFQEISTSSHFDFSANHGTLSYIIDIRTQYPGLSFSKGTALVFNEQGEKVLELPERLGGYHSIAVTSNLEYLAFKSKDAEKKWERNDHNKNEALYIYSVKDNKIVSKAINSWFQGPIGVRNLIYYTNWLENREELFFIFYNKLLYKYTFNHNSYKLISYEKDHLLLQNKKTKEEAKVYYNTMNYTE